MEIKPHNLGIVASIFTIAYYCIPLGISFILGTTGAILSPEINFLPVALLTSLSVGGLFLLAAYNYALAYVFAYIFNRFYNQ